MRERLTSERAAGPRAHPAGGARRPRLVVIEGEVSGRETDKDRRPRWRRVVDFVTDGLAAVPEQHFS